MVSRERKTPSIQSSLHSSRQPCWQVFKVELIQFAKAFQENLVLITSSTQSLGQHSLRQPWQPGKKHCTRIPKYQQLQPYLIYCIGWYQKNSSTFQALLLNTHLNSSNHRHCQISQYIITKFGFRSFKYRDQHHYHRLRPHQQLQSRERRCISVRLEFPLQPFYLSGNLFCLRKPGQLGSQSSRLSSSSSSLSQTCQNVMFFEQPCHRMDQWVQYFARKWPLVGKIAVFGQNIILLAKGIFGTHS